MTAKKLSYVYSQEQRKELKSLCNEKWKAIEDYEGHFEVSTKGRVKALERQINRGNRGTQLMRARMLNGSKNRHGYCHVQLYKDKQRKNWLRHRLVYKAFGKTDCDKLDINHLDGDKTNCAIANLEAVTRKENHRHAWRLKLHKSKTGKRTYKEARMRKTKVANCVQVGKTVNQIATTLGISMSSVCAIKNNRAWKHV